MVLSSKLLVFRIFPLVVLLSAGCSLGGISNAFRAEDRVAKTFETAKIAHVVVDTFNGTVEVSTEEGKNVKATVTKWATNSSQEAAEDDLVAIEVSMTQEGDTVRIRAQSKQTKLTGNRGANVVVQVPAGAILDLKTSNGKIKATGETGNVVAHSSNDGIEVKGSKGTLELATSNGRIDVDGGNGKLDLKTGNGNISIRSDNALVNAETSNGAVTFKGKLIDGEHSFQSSNGNLDLTLPEKTEFKIDAGTRNGKIDSDFRVPQGKDKKRQTILRGSVGKDPQITIKMHTTNGSIAIHKKK
jgi:Putative adhesin